MVKINDEKPEKQQANNESTTVKKVKMKKKNKVGEYKPANAPATSPNRAQISSSAPSLNKLTEEDRRSNSERKDKSTNVPATSSVPSLIGNKDSLQVKEKGEKTPERLPGFIFMCNGKTKPQCFQFQVFGLPFGQKEVVEQIKPGTKLFLYDFELKLLYGIYEATSEGKINLEPTAFEGKFPVQVKFKILNNCLPLPEQLFKTEIIDNYQGVKFKRELSEKHVNILTSLFRPMDVSIQDASTVPIIPKFVAQRSHKGNEDQYKPRAAAYLHRPSVPLAQKTMEQHRIQGLQNLQHQQRSNALLVDRSYPAMQAETYYSMHSQPPYYNGHPYPTYLSASSHGLGVQEPIPSGGARYQSGLPHSPYVPTAPGTTYSVSGDPYIGQSSSTVSTYYSAPVEPYVPSIVAATTTTYQTGLVESRMPHVQTLPTVSYNYSGARPERINW